MRRKFSRSPKLSSLNPSRSGRLLGSGASFSRRQNTYFPCSTKFLVKTSSLIYLFMSTGSSPVEPRVSRCSPVSTRYPLTS